MLFCVLILLAVTVSVEIVTTPPIAMVRKFRAPDW